MTSEEVRKILKDPRKQLKIAALSYVSLSEQEFFVVWLRYFAELTQEKAAERLPKLYEESLKIKPEKAIQEYSIPPSSLQRIEYRAIEKCRKAWDGVYLVKWMLKTQ